MLFFGGSVLKWLHSFSYTNSYGNVASISPGANIGLWFCELNKPNSSEHDDALFLGGLTAKGCLGYRNIFVKFEDSILIGTSFANMIRIGLCFKI
jgi:hypothetical protein